eukprot:CAMPEP_0179133038 /NCGR_PEP_ID=MMETSP0796-20121207/63252_1 /TAXON_ID=73915 /ORGANISM="Pyrodinium bahamense, Strain pbaha01" /LENGTH=195 /DNA_ID=CAMNT_0020831993 /DNA_START=60 /DNA_END=647 /DNA_ORIENTATION=-
MAVSGIEQTRFKGMLESLQQQDPEITHIIVYSKFVVAYSLQQDGPNPGWRLANIEGAVYLVHRRNTPRYQLLVKNQLHTHDLLDNLHPDWELDCQKNYVFYKVEDPSKRIRGLWFHDDAERKKIETTLEKTLEEIRTAPNELQTEPMPAPPEPKAAPQDSVTVSIASLRSALHSLADDDDFCKMIMQKLKNAKTQ